MNKKSIILAGFIFCFVGIIAGDVSARDPLTDSMNNVDLRKDGNPTEAASTTDKWWEGFQTGEDDSLDTALDNGFSSDSGIAYFIAFELDNLSTSDDTLTSMFNFHIDGSGSQGWLRYDSSNSEVEYNDVGTSLVETGGSLATGELYGAYVLRPGNGDLIIKVFNSQGQIVLSHSSAPGTINTGGSNVKVWIGSGQSGARELAGRVWEMRTWSSGVPSESDMDTLADPTDCTFSDTTVGGEFTFWKMDSTEPDSCGSDGGGDGGTGGNTTIGNTTGLQEGLVIHSPDWTEKDSVNVSVSYFNQNLTPVSIEDSSIVVFRHEESQLKFFDDRNNEIINNTIQIKLEQSDSQGAVWETRLTNVPEGQWTIVANATLSEGTVNATDSATRLKSIGDGMIGPEIAGLTGSQLLEVLIWTLIMGIALWKNWIFVSVITMLPLFGPIFRNAGANYPVNFIAGVFLVSLAVLVRKWADHWGEDFKSWLLS